LLDELLFEPLIYAFICDVGSLFPLSCDWADPLAPPAGPRSGPPSPKPSDPPVSCYC